MARRTAPAFNAWVAAFAALLAPPALPEVASTGGQLLRDVTFTAYPDTARKPELLRRLLSPLTAAKLQLEPAQVAGLSADPPLDVAAERFVVYVPPPVAGRAYGVLVFVPPWRDARLPQGWAATLDRHGLIFVSAARSGNEEPVLARREPLALLAAANIAGQYAVDPERVYVAGFSGGARVALRLALGYPDVFRGAILNAGSDPIGNAQIPLPPRELMLRFQATTRLVYVTGARDDSHLVDDMMSRRSLRQWCVSNVDDQTEPRAGHAVLEPVTLSWAIRQLDRRDRPDERRLAECRAAVDADLAARLQQVAAMRSGGRHADADRLLIDIDARFGGLAAPRSLDLARR
jgi:hypothetical protein